MSTKNVYFYKLSLYDTNSKKAVEVNKYKSIFEDIISKNKQNSSLSLSYSDSEPVVMDILEENENYLFIRLSKKRLNHSIQKRNYNTLSISPVLTPAEEASNGIEIFTYCIIGYKHGIISIAKNQGAPDINSINRMFSLYKNEYYSETDGVPNNQLIKELYEGDEAEINRITLEIPIPNVEILEKIFHVSDTELIQAVKQKTQSVLIEVKPERRGYIINDSSKIKKLISLLQKGKDSFRKIIFDGKPTPTSRQRSYDLFEEYFKYPINIVDTYTENGKRQEYDKEKIQCDYKNELTRIYNAYKDYILAICDRL